MSPTTTKQPAKSEQIFRSASPATQAIVKDLLNAERSVMHMRRRDDIHVNLVQIVKKHITKSSSS
ncbi:MAG: hypothetical protein QM790_16930 [Nibricoccus sp.]